MLSLRTRSGRPLVALSTASVFPERVADAFELAARLGYDGLEVMVSADAVSQDTEALRRLADYHSMPVLALHAPCLLVTQRVWGYEPWGKLVRAKETAQALGAKVVVVHPPFRWQRDYAPHWNPLLMDSPHVTLDLSHTATSGSDAFAMAEQLGDRLAHVHMADGTGVPNRDEHLVPGRGTQPCAPLLEKLAANGYPGMVVLEVNTRRATTREARIGDLTEALDFTRRHLAATPAVTRSRPPA